MTRFPAIPDVQPGKARRWNFDKSMRRGHLCIVALVRQPKGPGTWRLDRIDKVGRVEDGHGREIQTVESGAPITLNRREAWDGKRHWFSYAFDTTGDIRARELWDWWESEGRPSWRWPSQVKAAVLPFLDRS